MPKQMFKAPQAKVAAPKSLIRVDGRVAKLFIYDAIGFWGIEAKTVKEALADVTSERFDALHVYINSPGGSVFEGMAIYNSLAALEIPVITIVDGVAASIASVIALAATEVQMGDGTYFMIHNPWTIIAGDAAALRKEAGVLDKIADGILGIYTKRSGLSADMLKSMMDEETWMLPQEAIDNGFADRLVDQSEQDNAPSSMAYDTEKFNFRHIPDALIIASSTLDRPDEISEPDNVDPQSDQDEKLDPDARERAKARLRLAGAL
jgi:ATP-dependent Clp protease protease subunit